MIKTVFVIDDDRDFLAATVQILARVAPALRVYTAASGAEALMLFSSAGTATPIPALVVLDYHLDNRDAPAILDDMRAFDRLGDVPVLVLSQFIWQRDALAAMRAGAVGCRPKPSRVHALGELLLNFLGEQKDGDHPDRGG